MNLSPHFTLDELTRSDTATRLGIDNDPPLALYPALRETAAMLERIREHLSTAAGRPVPIRVSSGFRSLALNRALRSGDGSDHVQGLAADWTAPSFGTPYQIAMALAPHVDTLQIGQLIHEFGRWIHTGARRPARPVNRILTISAAGTRAGVHQV